MIPSIFPPRLYCRVYDTWRHLSPLRFVSFHGACEIECPQCKMMTVVGMPNGYKQTVGSAHSIIYATEYTRWYNSGLPENYDCTEHMLWTVRFDKREHLALKIGTLVRPLFTINTPPPYDPIVTGIQEAFISVPLTKDVLITETLAHTTNIHNVWGNVRGYGLMTADDVTDFKKWYAPYNLQIWWKEPIHAPSNNITYYGMTIRDENIL